MREDMYKVIVERPRRGKDGDAAAARLRNDFDGPVRLGMRAGRPAFRVDPPQQTLPLFAPTCRRGSQTQSGRN